MKAFIASLVIGAAVAAVGSARADETPSMWVPQQSSSDSGRYMSIPLQTWSVDAKSFVRHADTRRAAKGGSTKAATDRATVYRPVPVCRLIDTRGLAAAITVPGPLAPGSSTFVNASGFCGIPGGGLVSGLSLSFHVFNYTVNSGGYITFLQQDVPTVPVPPGVNAVFNEGARWTAATANVSIPNDSGNFKIYIANASVEVIVDVNGYYQDMDNLDVGTQELDIFGSVSGGDLFELHNLDTGSALALDNPVNGPALTVYNGTIRAAGAGVGTPTFAFLHQVTVSNTCAAFPSYSAILHPMLDSDPNAMIFITPRYNAGTGAEPAAATPIAEYLPTNTCGNGIPSARWFVRTPSTNLVTNAFYNIMVIKN
jgi:hypothetical protein